MPAPGVLSDFSGQPQQVVDDGASRYGCSQNLGGHVFRHGQPVVEFDPAPAACELADLLLVVDAIRTERRVRKAILVQAKFSARRRVPFLRAGDATEFEVLSP